jgi:hypothetical protein
MEPWAAPKKLVVSVAVPPAPVWVPSQRHWLFYNHGNFVQKISGDI